VNAGKNGARLLLRCECVDEVDGATVAPVRTNLYRQLQIGGTVKFLLTWIGCAPTKPQGNHI